MNTLKDSTQSNGMNDSTAIYLDYNASTPVDPAAFEAALPFFTAQFGNASSAHSYGKHAGEALKKARNEVAAMLHCDADSIYFTSGATECINWALKCSAFAQRDAGAGNHIITTGLEHSATYAVTKWLESKGFVVSICPSDANGVIKLEAIRNLMRSTTILVSVIHANAEVGSIQPIDKVIEIVKSINPKTVVHTDASQSVGKLILSATALKIDLISFTGHKVYAPKGVGVLYIKEGTPITAFIHGGGHQRNMRGGTENVPLCVALGKACQIIHSLETKGDVLCVNRNYHLKYEETLKLAREFKNALFDYIREKTARNDEEIGWFLRLNGDFENRALYVPTTLCLSIHGSSGSAIVQDLKDVLCISSGSACKSSSKEISSTMKSMGVSPDWASGTLRISFGRFTTIEECAIGGKILAEYLVKNKFIPHRDG